MTIDIHGKRVGIDIRGAGVPLILIHGFPLNRTMFDPQLEALSSATRVITFDVPGVGESESGPVSMDNIADLTAAILTQQGIDKAVVGGVSMGGYASFAFARRHPKRLLGLVLADTRAAPDSDTAKEVRREMARIVEEDGAMAAAERMVPGWFGPTTLQGRPELIRRVRDLVEAAPTDTIVRMLQALADRPDATPALSNIQVPTLVISGEEDPMIPPAEMAAWAALIPDARHVVIPATGHLPNLEDAPAFNRAVTDFLTGIA